MKPWFTLWEYAQCRASSTDMASRGGAGWELVCVDRDTAYFKRAAYQTAPQGESAAGSSPGEARQGSPQR